MVVMLGLVSLLADLAYEGGKSVAGAYLRTLGAMAVVAGAASAGEVLTHALRVVGGYLASVSRSGAGYWGLILAGYSISLASIPALAFASSWDQALALVLLERVGKGLRSAPRDALIAEASRSLGRGRAFGLHEAMDQVGAVAGPLVVAWWLAGPNTYRSAFLLLAIPAALSITFVCLAWISHPGVRAVEARGRARAALLNTRALGFLFFSASVSGGFVSWHLVSYHLDLTRVEAPLVPLLYSLAMLSDAVTALLAGLAYDRKGFSSLFLLPLASFLPLPLFLAHDGLFVLSVAAVTWGVSMGLQESVLRAAAADMTPPGQLPRFYGLLGATQGLASTAGGLVMGVLYQYSRPLLVFYSLALEAAGAVAVITLSKTGGRSRPYLDS